MDGSKDSRFENGVDKQSRGANPFVHHLQLSRYQKLQILVMSLTVAPIRLVLVVGLFAITWPLAFIFTVGSDPNIPAGRFRMFLYNFLQLMGRIISIVLGFHTINVKGKRASTGEAPVIIVMPHSSLWDVLIFFVSPPFPSALSKYENFQIPIFGTLMKAVQPILVHRNDASSKQRTINAIRTRMNSPERWPQLVVFPEGTCTNRKQMIRFKLGAFLAGTPVQPVVMRYLGQMDVSTWTEVSPSAFYLIWLTVCQIHVPLEVEYLPVYKPSAEEIQDPKLYANNAQSHLAKFLKIPCSDYTYEDRLLMKAAGKLNLPKEAAALQFQKVSSALHITLKDALSRLSEFAKMSSGRSNGLVEIENLARYLKLDVHPAVEDLFRVFDSDNDGAFTFRRYVTVYSTLQAKANTESRFESAYELYRHQASMLKSAGAQSTATIEINALVQEINKEAGTGVGPMNISQFTSFICNNPLFWELLTWHCDKLQSNNIARRSVEENIVHKRIREMF